MDFSSFIYFVHLVVCRINFALARFHGIIFSSVRLFSPPIFFPKTAFFPLGHYYRLPHSRSHVEFEFNFPVTVVIINNTHTHTRGRMQFKSVGAYIIYSVYGTTKLSAIK